MGTKLLNKIMDCSIILKPVKPDKIFRVIQELVVKRPQVVSKYLDTF